MWARRRWDAVGEPVLPLRSLFSYKFGDDEIEEELKFMAEGLWLAQSSDSATGVTGGTGCR